MIRQVRIGLAVALTLIIALVAFIYLWTSPFWTSRNTLHLEDTNTTQDAHQETDELDALKTEALKHKKTIAPHQTKNLSVDWVRPLTLTKKHRAAPVAHLKVKVQKGDCLWTLARRYNTTVTNIMDKNDLHSTLLQIGQTLVIPTSEPKAQPSPHTSNTPLTYTIRPGDTLWRISVEYGVSITNLEAVNHISAQQIHVGEKLTIDAQKPDYHPTPASKKLIKAAPKSLIPVYQAAGKKYGIPWTVLAAIHKEETDFDTTGTKVSCVGALGPMQFMPATFAIFGVPAPGHTHANIHNVYDAIYSTAHMLKETGFQKDPYHAIFLYNHSISYVDDILRMSSI